MDLFDQKMDTYEENVSKILDEIQLKENNIYDIGL